VPIALGFKPPQEQREYCDSKEFPFIKAELSLLDNLKEFSVLAL